MNRSHATIYPNRLRYILPVLVMIFSLFTQAWGNKLQNLGDQPIVDTNHTTEAAALKSQVVENWYQLHYPLSVLRFYQSLRYKLVWVAPDTVKTYASDAMLLLDCVRHYGLSHADYHPDILQYEKLADLVKGDKLFSPKEKALFDVFLTDAILTLINNLHFGKLNPQHPSSELDAGNNSGLKAAETLKSALFGKNFTAALEQVQPISDDYHNMQNYMRLLVGQYTGDCYVVPKDEVRKIAINMERIRWLGNDSPTYIEINIPAYTMKFHHAGIDEVFKIMIGNQAIPLIPMQRNITQFTNDRRMFRVSKNRIIIPGSLSLDRNNQRSCLEEIGITHSAKLAKLILRSAGDVQSIKKLKRVVALNKVSTFALKESLPLYVTYITCQIKDGTYIKYEDIYNLDEGLELAFYGVIEPLAFH